MVDVWSWEIDADDNTFRPPDGWPEGMQYNKVDENGREMMAAVARYYKDCLLYTSPSPRDRTRSRMPSSA